MSYQMTPEEWIRSAVIEVVSLAKQDLDKIDEWLHPTFFGIPTSLVRADTPAEFAQRKRAIQYILRRVEELRDKLTVTSRLEVMEGLVRDIQDDFSANDHTVDGQARIGDPTSYFYHKYARYLGDLIRSSKLFDK